jgi:type IV pilus assembly protein PilO
MEALLNRIAQLQLAVKLAILTGLLALIATGYYFVYYTDLVDQQAQQEDLLKKAHLELGQYQKRSDQRKAWLNERNQLLEEQRELLRMLPHSDDIERFIESMNSQVEASGLTKVSSVRETAVPEEIYLRIPIRMTVNGSYHQIDRFFKNMAELQRIVTISDLSLTAADTRPATMAGPLKAEFVAQTFQLPDDARIPAPAAPAAGGKPAAKEGGR